LGKYVRELEQYSSTGYSTGPPYVEIEEQRDLKTCDIDLLRAAVKRAGCVDSQETAVLISDTRSFKTSINGQIEWRSYSALNRRYIFIA
jgi:hypothetical protein